jgi:L-ribulose-5-phosphate 3-epimerase
VVDLSALSFSAPIVSAQSSSKERIMPLLRREFLQGMLAMTAATAASGFALLPAKFRISIVNDEISQDFGHACEIASREFGMGWIELRSMWNKNIVNLSGNEIVEAQRILAKFQLKVTDIASPLFKTDFPGGPKSKYSGTAGFNANFTYDQQNEVLDRSIEMAKAFQADRVRCFDFWRLEDQTPHRPVINEMLRQAALKAAAKDIRLVLENEPTCNTGTGAEAAKVLAAVQTPYLLLNWDAGNAAALGEVPFPDGYNLLPKDRLGHCHCKDIVKKGNKYDWAPMGGGIIDWAGQFKALKRDGYRLAVSLETHWNGGGSPEESSRKSWTGMKALLQKADAL